MPAEALQRKIKTTKDLREIVSNMKTLSSVSILQYEQANAVLREYKHNLRDAFQALAIHNDIPNLAIPMRVHQRYLFILIGSDNGMVGRFNRELIGNVADFISEQNISSADTYFVTVGKRLFALAEQAKSSVLSGFATSNSVKSIISLAEQVILRIDKAILQNRVSEVYVCYHQRRKNAAVEVKMKKLLPIDIQQLQQLRYKKWETNNIPLVPAKPDKMFAALLRESLTVELAECLNLSLAAEHFTRMTNMQNAEKNIDENLEEMDLEYQQQRQEEITSELIDVISGANAMKKDES